MTPAEFHFVAGLSDVAKNLTLRDATANATFQTIMSADVSELTMPAFWIQLGLLPVPGIIACYVFGKIVNYLHGSPPTDRQPLLATDNATDVSKQPTERSQKGLEEDTDLSDVQPQRKRRSNQRKEEDRDVDDVQSRRKARSYQQNEGNDDPVGVQSQRTTRFRQQIDRNHGSADRLREQTFREKTLRRGRSVSGSVQPRGTVESGHLAGATAKEKNVIGKKPTQTPVDGGSLTRSRPIDGERGLGV